MNKKGYENPDGVLVKESSTSFIGSKRLTKPFKNNCGVFFPSNSEKSRVELLLDSRGRVHFVKK